MTKFNSIRDFLWTLQAYLRGKILRQKAYRPQTQGNFSVFRATTGTTARRATMLIKWWGRRPMSVEDMALSSEQCDDPDHVRVYVGHFDNNLGSASAFVPRD